MNMDIATKVGGHSAVHTDFDKVKFVKIRDVVVDTKALLTKSESDNSTAMTSVILNRDDKNVLMKPNDLVI